MICWKPISTFVKLWLFAYGFLQMVFLIFTLLINTWYCYRVFCFVCAAVYTRLTIIFNCLLPFLNLYGCIEHFIVAINIANIIINFYSRFSYIWSSFFSAFNYPFTSQIAHGVTLIEYLRCFDLTIIYTNTIIISQIRNYTPCILHIDQPWYFVILFTLSGKYINYAP
jgi:hypothetical protein